MAPNPRVAKAFRAMKNLGITEEKVKPVLKNLLKLYEKKWELIEEENYRVLADSIFEYEETEAAECQKKNQSTEQEKELEEEAAQVHDEPERPLKRLRLRYQDGPVSPSPSNSSPGVGGSGASTKRPKVEVAETPETCPQQQEKGESLIRNKGKQPIFPKPLSIQEPSQPCAIERTQPVATRRAETGSISSPISLRDKGKEILSPPVVAREKRPISERSSHLLLLKEPKIEPGIGPLPIQKVADTNGLIQPKDEPFTDDVPQFEIPIAVIHPESLSKGNSLLGNGSIREPDGPQALASEPVDGEGKSDDVPISSSTRTNRELANILDESASNLEIASSPSGEVKISLSCNSALGRPDFHMPNLDDVLKLVEEKCLKSYKVMDPTFSVKKLMKDMCESVLELGTHSADESQEALDVTPVINLLKESNAHDSCAARGMPYLPMNGSVNAAHAAKAALPRSPIFPSSFNGTDDCVEPGKNISENGCELDNEKEQNCLDDPNSHSLVVVQRCQLSPDGARSLHDVKDIAKGQESVVISLVNEVNRECPPSFHYIPQNVVFQNAYVNFSLARIGDYNCCSTCSGDCVSSSTRCVCSHEKGGSFAYTLEGLVKEDFLEECISMNRDPQKHCLFYCKECPIERSKNEEMMEPCKGHLVRKFIKECWWKCGCSRQCSNRVVQRGINCNLQVFMTAGGKGWGLRTLEDLPKGAFVCEYVGEVLTNGELYERVSRIPSNEEHAYPVLLDADWGSEGALKDEEALCLDATYYGNVARFINHRCFDSTLVEIPVEVETPDHHYYHVAFFTTRKVEAFEELTWDYGIDFDDHDHPFKAFQCRCGSKFCRNIKRSNRSKSRATRM